MLKKLSILAFTLGFMATASYAATGPETLLIVKPTTIVVNGKQTKIYTIQQPDGTWGYTGIEGQEFNAVVENKTSVPITIHWHGLIVPSNEDGVPFVSQDPIAPGSSYHYRFKLVQSGTYWMHSHYGFEIQQGMYAPLIITSPNDAYKNAKDVIMLVSDFSFKSPEKINYDLTHQAQASMGDMNGMQMSHNNSSGMSGMKMSDAAPDLNDVKYDAYLTNYHTLQEPEIVQVIPGEAVRLRIINGASASNFFINLGKLPGKVIATDGELIKPVTGSTFGISEGQRLDIIVKIPSKMKQAYPILAEAEGTNQQTGLILATPGAKIPTISETAAQSFGAINALQDREFHALHPLAEKPISRKITVTLQGDMAKYIWKINNQVWPYITPIMVKKGDRVQMTIINQTSMAHPMHLHGHVFEVVAVNGKAIADGPLRDTVFIPANGSATIEFDANNPGNWMLHCHVLYHAEDGMMTIMQYEGVATPEVLINHKTS